MRQKYPDYPSTVDVDQKAVHECLSAPRPRARRSDLDAANSNHTESNELLYEPEALQARGFVDRVQAAGKDLFLRQNPLCTTAKVTDNFMWTEGIVTTSVQVCERLKSDIQLSGVATDGGTGFVVDKLFSGHDKQGHQLKDNVKVAVYYTLKFVPPAQAAVSDIKAIAQGIYDLCNDGIERILTRGSGCTQDIRYFRPSKGRTYTGSGARSGEVDLFWGDTSTVIANLAVDFAGGW
jgi:hypothetical protein